MKSRKMIPSDRAKVMHSMLRIIRAMAECHFRSARSYKQWMQAAARCGVNFWCYWDGKHWWMISGPDEKPEKVRKNQ